jgi:uncharacterized DUF497 family protein
VKTRFEWDPEKARINLRKHRVSFELATRVFADPLRLTDLDQIVEGEIRWKAIGSVEHITVLVVVHTFPDPNDEEAIRIISARRATRWERRRYEEETG